MNYIIVIDNVFMEKVEIIGRCNGRKIKDLYELYKREYPNVDLKVFKEVNL